ncbi:MAG: radical SAM protein [Candidatus Buchananbacteria bacterium]|nr:radical SAM protein [Candidatus Buchananbacteria bacterium]
MANLGYIQLNRVCNQACLFCSNPDTGASLNFIEFKDKVADLIKRNYDGVILTGGEPTLIDYLPEAIKFCTEKKINSRLITNGQNTANFEYLKKLKDSGLNLMHVSLYSYKTKIQNYLSQNNDSYNNIIKTLKNATKLNIVININTVINKYNADHLDKTVFFIIRNFPQIKHFVFNNLDPYMNRASQNKHTIPGLFDFEISLNKAMQILFKNNKTFRVERVPLCYMGDFPQFSTETRKIIKQEERVVHFLDEKGLIRQDTDSFKYKKGKVCKRCNLNDICAGLYSLGEYFAEKELKPVKNVTKEQVKAKL